MSRELTEDGSNGERCLASCKGRGAAPDEDEEESAVSLNGEGGEGLLQGHEALVRCVDFLHVNESLKSWLLLPGMLLSG